MKQFRNIRMAGVPLVAINTSDPAPLIKACMKELASIREVQSLTKEEPVTCWDIVQGLVGVNETGKDMCSDISPDGPIQTGNPTECLSLLAKLERRYDDCV